MKNFNVKNIVIAVSAIIILGLGIGMFVKIGIGVDSLSAFETAVSMKCGISLGTACALCNVAFIVLSLIINRKYIGVASIAFVFISKFPVDFAQRIMFTTDNLFINILLGVLAILILALGSEMFILSNLGANAYDSMILAIQSKLKKEIKYVYLRYIVDGTFLLLAFILGGPIGIGTILCWALMGNFMRFWEKILIKVLKLDVKGN